MLDSLSNAILDAVRAVLDFLPDSPFVVLEEMSNAEYYQWLKWLNWFIPVYAFVAILQAWLVCVAIYYVIQIVLRWIKAIE